MSDEQGGKRSVEEFLAGDWKEQLAELDQMEMVAPDGTPLELAGEGLLATPAPRPGHHIVGTKFDQWLFEQALKNTPLGRSVWQGEQGGWETTKELAADLRNTFFQHQPEKQEVDDAHQANAQALDTAMTLPEFEKLRTMTTADEFNSDVAASQFTNTLVEELLKERKENEQAQQEQQQQNPPPQSQQDGDPQAGDQPGTGGGKQQPGAAQPGQQNQPSQEQAEQARKALQQSAMRRALRSAASAAEGAVKESEALLATFGGGEDEIGSGWGTETGSESRVNNLQQRVKLARMASANPRIAKIAQVAGRLRFVAAAAQKARIDAEPDENIGLTTGNDLRQVLSSEMAYLADPETEDLFWVKYLGKTLRQRLRAAFKKAGKGPIVLCVDESGSMSGGRNDWAAGIGLSLLSIAAKQKRDFCWIHFGGPDEMDIDVFDKGRGTPEHVLDVALHFFGGGTDFDTPLNAALAAIQTSMFKKADVVFLTDGLCQVSTEFLQEWLAVKKEKQFACYGMLIGGGSESLKTFCDTVSDVTPNERDEGPLTTAFSV